MNKKCIYTVSSFTKMFYIMVALLCEKSDSFLSRKDKGGGGDGGAPSIGGIGGIFPQLSSHKCSYFRRCAKQQFANFHSFGVAPTIFIFLSQMFPRFKDFKLL